MRTLRSRRKPAKKYRCSPSTRGRDIVPCSPIARTLEDISDICPVRGRLPAVVGLTLVREGIEKFVKPAMTEISSPSMPRRLPPGCSEDRDRHGNVRIYYRPKGRPKVRLRGEPWTPGFMAAYEAAKGIEFKTSDRSRAALPGTWRWLCVRYFSECADYKRLDARTQRVRRQILEGTFNG